MSCSKYCRRLLRRDPTKELEVGRVGKLNVHGCAMGGGEHGIGKEKDDEMVDGARRGEVEDVLGWRQRLKVRLDCGRL